MDGSEELSVLEYARSHGIARNHQQLVPLDLLAHIHDSEHAQSLSSNDSTSQFFNFETLDLDFPGSTSTITSRNKKLILDRDGVNFLAFVLQEAKSLQAILDYSVEDTLPLQLKYKPWGDLKIDVPLLSAKKQDALKALRKRASPIELLNDIAPDLLIRERANIDEGLEFPDYFWELPSMLDRDPSTEKLEASKGTALILLEALAYFDEKKHRKDADEFVSNFILDSVSFSQLATPSLYIESKKQHAQHVDSTFQHGIDTDTGYDNEAAVERVATPGLLKQDTPGDTSSSNESETQHECKVIREFRSSDTNIGFAAEVVSEEVVTPGLPEESNQPFRDDVCVENEEQHESSPKWDTHRPNTDIELNVALAEYTITPEWVDEHNSHFGDTLTSKRAASPIPVHEPEVITERSPRSSNALSLVAKPPGSLGTLSTFMQTICHKNKRRKLGHESRYFNSTPKSSTKTCPVEIGSPEKPTETTTGLCSPATKHSIQSLHLYPEYHSSKSRKSVLLIVSMQLLRSDSTLIRSLEDISVSRSVRLIFRDYQRANPSQPRVIDEADLIVSPTTGIIIASSHETTQKYLPGQGPPGIDSPLYARIIQATLRYEMLYVLIRSPLETSMNTLSSVRDLTNYCISLNHICCINVLLIATDHVLEWILSIAAKHTIDPGLLPALNATESEKSASLFHDDQTQWEVFLRNSGLNPFAAQSILAILRTNPTQADYSEDGNQMSALSRFVEMSYRTRKDMFQRLVGPRVLSRVNKALEMDWQIDWAVDLT